MIQVWRACNTISTSQETSDSAQSTGKRQLQKKVQLKLAKVVPDLG